MPGPAPSLHRRRTNEPARGDWQAPLAAGWRHGGVPDCPVRSRAAQATWAAWMASSSAARWDPSDLPHLRLLIGLWARVDAGAASREQHALYVRLADDLGITFRGRQDRRWLAAEAPSEDEAADEAPALRVVGGHGG